MIPDDRKYTQEHEWVLIEEGVATIGVTDFAAGELGDVVFVELPETGSEFSQGDAVVSGAADESVGLLGRRRRWASTAPQKKRNTPKSPRR